MDRRSFFKTLTAAAATAPALAPLLLASKRTLSGLEIFIIADDPHALLPDLVKEACPVNGGRFSVLTDHPQAALAAEALSRKGWITAASVGDADLTLACRPLQDEAQPSFTVVEKGKVWDLRHGRLSRQWEKMAAAGKKSRLLTTASFRVRGKAADKGTQAALYRNGRLVARLPLDKDTKKSLETGKGLLTVVIEDGTARVDHSSCRHKICVATPPAALAGERIICAPNHFLLEIEGASGVDTMIG
jgi:hypothetical protein